LVVVATVTLATEAGAIADGVNGRRVATGRLTIWGTQAERTRHKCASPDRRRRPRLSAWPRPTWDLDDVFLDALAATVLAALERIGDDPVSRFRFFRWLLSVAQEEALRRRLS
jgi:hypothetical protein